MNSTSADTARTRAVGSWSARGAAHLRTGGRPPSGTLSTDLGLLAATIAALVWICGAGPSNAGAAEKLTPQRQRELLREGLNAFDEAVGVAREDPARAESLYRSAAAAFETLSDHGVRNAALEYNLGNAYFRLGELGRAIVHYRRAQWLDPTDAALSANLEYTRNRVEPYIEPTGTRQLIGRLMFWTNHVSIQDRFWLAAIGSAAGWLGLVFRLRWRLRPLTALPAVAIVFGLANAASVAWQLHDQAHHAPAVVVGSERVLRLGRGEGYDPALSQPLGPGVELRILSERAGWVEVQLPDAQTGWLPLNAVEKI